MTLNSSCQYLSCLGRKNNDSYNAYVLKDKAGVILNKSHEKTKTNEVLGQFSILSSLPTLSVVKGLHLLNTNI